MKRIFLFGVMAVAALVSCTKDDVVEVNKGKGIFFSALLDNPVTRANVVDRDNFGEFHVIGIGDNNGNKEIAMPANKVKKENNIWKCSTLYYWPAYDVDFFAFSHLDGADSKVGINTTSQKITGFKPKRKVSEQEDLVICRQKGKKVDHETVGVPLLFKHALSQIEIKAKCSNPGMKIKVKGVKLANVATSGTFTFPTTDTEDASSLGQDLWGDLRGGDQPAYVIRDGQESETDALELTEDAQSLMFGDNNFMLIPQKKVSWEKDANGAYISVLCQIIDPAKKQVFPKTKNLYGFAAVPVEINWSPGYKYTYILNFCDGEDGGVGKVDPDPKDPTNPTDPIIDPDPATPGEILGKAIKFTVEVSSWKDKTPAEEIKAK